MRIAETITVHCRPSAAWERIRDPSRYAELMEGVTRWDRVDRRRKPGLGARYSMLMEVGAAEIGGIVEIVEYHERRDIAWTSITGIGQRGRWRLREVEPGRCAVSLRLSYQAPGGLWGLLADWTSAPRVRTAVGRTLDALRRDIENGQST